MGAAQMQTILRSPSGFQLTGLGEACSAGHRVDLSPKAPQPASGLRRLARRLPVSVAPSPRKWLHQLPSVCSSSSWAAHTGSLWPSISSSWRQRECGQLWRKLNTSRLVVRSSWGLAPLLT